MLEHESFQEFLVMPGSHYSDFSARNQRFLGEKSAISRREISTVHTTMISGRFLGEKSFLAISCPDIAEKISGPTERHVTSHVIDLDICEFLIMDARR